MKIKLLSLVVAFVISFSLVGQNVESGKWNEQTLDGLTIRTPILLEKQNIQLNESFANLLSRLNMYLAVNDDLAVIYNFMEFKEQVDYNLENGLLGAVKNSIRTMNGTDLKFKTHHVRKNKHALTGKGEFIKDDETIQLESFGHWNEGKNVIMVIALAFTKKGKAMATDVISSAQVK